MLPPIQNILSATLTPFNQFPVLHTPLFNNPGMDLLSWQTPDGYKRERHLSALPDSIMRISLNTGPVSLDPFTPSTPGGTGVSNLIKILEEFLGLLVQLSFFFFGVNLPGEYNISLYRLSCLGLPGPVIVRLWESQPNFSPRDHQTLKPILPAWSLAITKWTRICSTYVPFLQLAQNPGGVYGVPFKILIMFTHSFENWIYGFCLFCFVSSLAAKIAKKG